MLTSLLVDWALISSKELLSLVGDGKLNMFHAAWLPGHHSTDYDKYYKAPAGQIYRVTSYQYSYEPYIIFKKNSAPW